MSTKPLRFIQQTRDIEILADAEASHIPRVFKAGSARPLSLMATDIKNSPQTLGCDARQCRANPSSTAQPVGLPRSSILISGICAEAI
jgi:hypothetical protein